MALYGIQFMSKLNQLSFQEASVLAKDKCGELCVLVIFKKRRHNQGVRTQFWVLNGPKSEVFYNKHRNKKGSAVCIATNWFIEHYLGIGV